MFEVKGSHLFGLVELLFHLSLFFTNHLQPIKEQLPHVRDGLVRGQVADVKFGDIEKKCVTLVHTCCEHYIIVLTTSNTFFLSLSLLLSIILLFLHPLSHPCSLPQAMFFFQVVCLLWHHYMLLMVNLLTT